MKKIGLENMRRDRLHIIWHQTAIPRVYHGPKPPMLVRIPYAPDNRAWLKDTRRTQPKWNAKDAHWELPRLWFNDTIRRIVSRFGSCWLIQEVNRKQICAPACWNARGLDCQCSCMGANHGTGCPGGRWYEVSDALAVSRGERELSCRLIVRKKGA
jgi:hypothetical protein